MAGCCRNTSVAGLIEAGDNVTVTGSGTAADPYVISSAAEGIPPAITGLISAGTNTVLSGTGTSADPYVLASNVTGLVTAGANITRTGAGTVASPYVFAAVPTAANLVTAGSNVTRTGAGTTGSPYVFAAHATGLVSAGTNVTITGSGTSGSPYVVSSQLPARGAPVALTLNAPATSTNGITVTRNPDGSATLNGDFDMPGPLVAGDPFLFSVLPAGWGPGGATGIRTVAVGFLNASPVALRIDINPGPGAADMFLVGPAVAEGETLDVSIDELTFWPTS